ncbi:chromatin-binding protein [Hanseniaspora uvarum]|nr:chromatin-binding protein [Hanseniaspora uvarum]
MSTSTPNENNTTEAASLETPVFTIDNPAPAPEPENMDPSSNPIPDHQVKYASTSIRNIKRLKDAKPFINPVDPIALNIPQYYHFIKKPMSISVIEQKLQKGVYSDVEEFFDDFKLMIDNAIKFNGEKSLMADLANNLLQTFTKHMHNMPPKEIIKPVKKAEPKSTALPAAQTVAATDDTSVISSIGSRSRRQVHPPKSKDIYTGESLKTKPKPKDKNVLQDLTFAKQVIKDLTSKKHQDINFPFLEPVDYVGLNIPHYLDFVKTPMDLGTVQKKLLNWEYSNFDEFVDDVTLVFNNCYAFNPEGTDVNIMGKTLEKIFKELLKKKPEHEVSEEDVEEEEYSQEEESDSEDLEKELIKAGKNNPAILMLEQQIATFQEQLRAMREIEYKNLFKNKKGGKNLLKKVGMKKKRAGRKPKTAETPVTRKRRKSSSAGGVPQKRKTSISQEPVVQASYEMKKYMSEKLEQFSMDEMNAFTTFISTNIPASQMPKDENGESYLDLSQLQGNYVILLFNTFFQRYGDFYETPQIPNEQIFNTPSTVSSPFINQSPVSAQRKINQEGGKLEQIKQKLQSMNTKASPGTSLPNSTQNFSASPNNMKPRGLYLNNDNDQDSSDDESESEED